MGYKEIDSCVRILLANFDQTRLDDVHRNARSSFTNDYFGRRELSGFQTSAQLGETVRTEFSEEFDFLLEEDKLIDIVDYRRHVFLFARDAALPSRPNGDDRTV